MTDDPRDITERLTTDERVLLDLQGKATPLPWTDDFIPNEPEGWHVIESGNHTDVAADVGRHGRDPKGKVAATAAYLVAAANAVPALLSTIASLRRERDEIADELAHAYWDSCGCIAGGAGHAKGSPECISSASPTTEGEK